MYDVFRFLTGAPVESIDGDGDRSRRAAVPRATTISAATIGYEDGSVASLVYTALGPKTGLGKEHIEVFCDGEAFIVDDFKKLTRASDGSGAVAERRARQGPLRRVEPLRRRASRPAGRRRFRSTRSSRPPRSRLHIEDLLHRPGRSGASRDGIVSLRIAEPGTRPAIVSHEASGRHDRAPPARDLPTRRRRSALQPLGELDRMPRSAGRRSSRWSGLARTGAQLRFAVEGAAARRVASGSTGRTRARSKCVDRERLAQLLASLVVIAHGA